MSPSPPNNSTAFDVTPETGNRCNDSNCNEQQHQHQRKQQLDWEGPPAQGLYDPANEHEACGVGFIVAIDGKRSHKVCVHFTFLHQLKTKKKSVI